MSGGSWGYPYSKEFDELVQYSSVELLEEMSDYLNSNGYEDVAKDVRRLVDLEKAMDKSTLYDWYVTSVKQKDTPVWTGEHIEELLNDFYIIPKD